MLCVGPAFSAGCGRSAVDAGPDAWICVADCECAQGCCTTAHVCVRCARPPVGLCGSPPGLLPCACVGGTCDERRCCVLPDARIAVWTDPECTGPDAAVP